MSDSVGIDHRGGGADGHEGILQTLIDISRIITTSHNLDETLSQTVHLIAERMSVDVCSIYLYEEDDQRLELKATHGLNPTAVGQVRMNTTEGLIGMAIETRSPVNVLDVASHPRFKYFPSIDEDKLSSFLGVPLIEYRKPIGVLAIQNQEHRQFTAEEERLLITIASQISGLISKAIVVERVQEVAGKIPKRERPEHAFQLEGIPIAPGLAKEKVMVLTQHRIEEPAYASKNSPQQEEQALRKAVEESVEEILHLIQDVTTRIGGQDAAIFHAHLLFLEDRNFIQRIVDQIQEGASASWAVSHVVREHLKAFQSIEDPYLQERGADLEDIGFRLLHHLGQSQPRRLVMERPVILVAENLTPSDTAQLDPQFVKGIVTTYGGHVSHASILARSLRIPAVSGITDAVELLLEGEEVLVDGESGTVFVNPDAGLVQVYERHQVSQAAYLSHLDELRDVLCTTKDGERIILRANVGLAQDLEDFTRYGAEGIGLYRTEIYYLMRSTCPTIEELVETYSKVLKTAGGQPVIFRTLDLGGDKFPSYLHFPKEENPFLGIRSIRYQLRWQSLLKEQIKAILQVAHMGDTQLMFPMISHLDELHEVKRIYLDCRRELEQESGKALPEIKLGMMFEVPSAVLMCEHFVGELDFLSIGSNDLTQYVLAVDRNNPNVSHLYDPLDPAVLIMIKRLIETANRHGKPIELCGEMSSDPEGCLVLAGMGLRELSMNAPLIPIVKDRLSQYTLAELQRLSDIAMDSTTAENVRRNIQLSIGS
ncbi:MAG: phosphoenolpyruvate--protein phosphotransferase [SAR324 cluster bacterium]|nr:phosphoenolpyruvate--protein phosphotransferase [SAR324 cluster bacterium]